MAPLLEEAKVQENSPIITPPDQVLPTYSGAVALKKVTWAIGKLATAKLMTPAVMTAFIHFTEKLPPYGITVVVDQDLLANALRFAIFAALVAGHDALKVKTGIKWL